MEFIRSDDGVRVTARVNKADLDDIREQLDQLSPRLAKRLVRSSFRKACEYLRDLMKSKAPVLADKTNKDAVPGELRDSIDYKISTGRSGARGADANALDRVYAKVGPKWITNRNNKTMNPGLYAMFVEFGLRAKQYVSQPFARPTFDSGAERALNIVAEDLRERLPEIVAKRGTGVH